MKNSILQITLSALVLSLPLTTIQGSVIGNLVDNTLNTARSAVDTVVDVPRDIVEGKPLVGHRRGYYDENGHYHHRHLLHRHHDYDDNE